MARNILILGASYGSLLATKLLMAGHNVTLVCRQKTADLINRDGTEVRIKLRDEPNHRSIFSRDLPGKLDACPPQNVDVFAQSGTRHICMLMVDVSDALYPTGVPFDTLTQTWRDGAVGPAPSARAFLALLATFEAQAPQPEQTR